MAVLWRTSCANKTPSSFQVLGLLTLSLLAVVVADKYEHKDYPFWNASLSWDERLDDLLGRLLLDDMTLMMARGGAVKNSSPGINREGLGIKPYNWNTECLRGEGMAGNATSFPQALGLAAAFR